MNLPHWYFPWLGYLRHGLGPKASIVKACYVNFNAQYQKGVYINNLISF